MKNKPNLKVCLNGASTTSQTWLSYSLCPFSWIYYVKITIHSTFLEILDSDNLITHKYSEGLYISLYVKEINIVFLKSLIIIIY